MQNIEIPVGKRSLKYRLFEMLPATFSYGALILLVVLSFVSPLWASIYVMLIIVITFVKSVFSTISTVNGRERLKQALAVDWHSRLEQLENPVLSISDFKKINDKNIRFNINEHYANLKELASHPDDFPKPSQIYNAIILTAYNESYEVINSTVESLQKISFPLNNVILILAYEERGGDEMEKTAKMILDKYKKSFFQFFTVKHPKDIPNEVIGKGGNITYSGKFLKGWLDDNKINYNDVIVTTLDSDNKPYYQYFDYVAYEYIVHRNRERLSYQPISLFFNNIWDAPAPTRIVATNNSFWNIISSVRVKSLRNFAAHSQPMSALVKMNFWSTRTVVEDGHQYWRSYFYFNGDYSVLPIYVPINQDAVMSNTYFKSLKAQFVQLRRWEYGASDIPYVAVRIFSSKRTVPFWKSLLDFLKLLEGHISLGCTAIIIAIGGWVPLFLNGQAARDSMTVHNLPNVVSFIETVAMVGLAFTIIYALRVLPPRPERYKKTRSLGMLLQWILVPVVGIIYSAFTALSSQGRLFIGNYLDKFDVTEKATVASIKQDKLLRKSSK